MGDVVTGIIAFLNGFLAAPLGQSILVVLVVTIAGYYLRGWSKDRLTSQRLKSDEAKGKLDGEIRKMELENERKEDDRQALANAENRTLLAKLADTQANIVTILQRMETRQQTIEETTRDVKDNTDVIAQRASVINKNILAVGNKVDAVQADSRSRTANLMNQINENDKQTWGMINTRTQKIEGAFDDFGHRLETKQNERHSQQMELMDQVLKELVNVGNKIVIMQKENASTPKAVDDAQLSKVLGLLGEIFEIVKPKKKPTGDLDPAKIPTDPVAIPTIANVIPKRNTEPLPPPPPDVHDTQPLAVTPPKEDA